MPDLKAIYRAETAATAATELEAFEAQWGKRYPAIGQAWRRAWEYVVPLFAFPPAMVKLLLAQLRHGFPVQPGRRGPVEIFLHGRARDPHAARHRCIAQPQPPFEPKHFLDPPHRHLRSWHLPAPPKRGDGSRHYLPLSSEARADQGCRKRRNQVPDWSEIRCRFPPESPAAFDRNQVPVCSDFCSLNLASSSKQSVSRGISASCIEKAAVVVCVKFSKLVMVTGRWLNSGQEQHPFVRSE